MYHVLVVHAAGGEKLVVRGKGVVAVMKAIEGLGLLSETFNRLHDSHYTLTPYNELLTASRMYHQHMVSRSWCWSHNPRESSCSNL
jgi:hypothetical protein